MNKIEVLYEDNHIIGVFKPNNILSQSDATKDIDLLTMTKEYIKEKYNKPGNVYLGLVHRLDRPVSGVMIFAKSSKAAARLTNMIKNHQIEKRYYAVINGTMKEKNGVLKDYLLKDENGNAVITDKEHGKESILEYNVLEEKEGLSLIDINLKTGRHHQIRIQFASRNHPLYGDQRYGKQDNNQIALHSYKLKFTHPVSKEIIEIIRKPEKKGIWKNFKI